MMRCPAPVFRHVSLGVALSLGMVLSGCSRDITREAGVVAVVDGTPIRLADLEARHDLAHIGEPVVENPAVEQLRAEYGEVLAEMIVVRLVNQDLRRHHLSITPEDQQAAEDRVRADYPGDSFNRMLLEERIDLPRWRAILKERLALEKFTQEVLRQNIRVDVSEAANYYKEHLETFAVPAQVRLAQVQGEEGEAVKAALTAYRKSGKEALAQSKGVSVRQALLPEKNLPANWQQAIKGLKSGEATSIFSADKSSQFLVVLERRPATVLDPAKAYSRVETLLAGQKLKKAFAAWLSESLMTTKITVNRELLATSETTENGKAQPSPTAGLSQDETPVRNALAPTLPQSPVAEQPSFPKVASKSTEPQKEAATAEKGGAGQAQPTVVPASPAPRPVDIAANAAQNSVPGNLPLPSAHEETAAPATTDAHRPVPADGGPESTPKADTTTVATATAPAAADAAAKSPPEAVPAQPPVLPEAAKSEKGESIVFTAHKGSWILYTVDEGEQQRVYLKPGTPWEISFSRKLHVRLGSPSEVSYRQNGRETTITVGKKESRVLEFP